MPKQSEVWHISAFTDNPAEGNKAAVLFTDNLSDTRMREIARNINYSETAFLSTSESADYRLRWFSPETEVSLCGHATIASLHCLFSSGVFSGNRTITFETQSGNLICSQNSGIYSVRMPVYDLTELVNRRSDLIKDYNIPDYIIDSSTPVLTLSNNYVFVRIKSYKDLISYDPHLMRTGKTVDQFSDLCLFTTETIESSSAAHQRFFAPGAGITEDPVTGSAAAYLALVLFRTGLTSRVALENSVVIEQGDHLGRKGRVFVSYNPGNNELIISGKAVTIYKESFII